MTEAEFEKMKAALKGQAARARNAIKQTMRPQQKAALLVKVRNAEQALDRLALRYELGNLAMLADGA